MFKFCLRVNHLYKIKYLTTSIVLLLYYDYANYLLQSITYVAMAMLVMKYW